MLQWHYNVHLYYFCTFLSNYDGSIQHGEGKKKKEKREQQQKKHTDDDTDSNWYADKNMQCHTDIGNIKIYINEKKKKM